VKGRRIWGGLVPYGQVWRTGANDATTISFSTAVKVAGHEVPAGKYAFFAIPRKGRWTLILNKEADQWGAFNYKQDQDLLRFDVRPRKGDQEEWLEYSLDLKRRDTAMATLAWAKVEVSFPISADVDAIYQAYLVDEEKKADASEDPKRARTYLAAAKYWINRNEHLDEASALLDKAGKITESFWTYEWKARLLRKQGRTQEALPLLDKAREMAPAAGAPKEYVEGLVKLRAEWTKG
jgi:tetratricopeptide (TPR) repeat protein